MFMPPKFPVLKLNLHKMGFANGALGGDQMMRVELLGM
jgi:hypothetical protein